MTAIRCKTILCANGLAATAATANQLSEAMAQNPQLSLRVQQEMDDASTRLKGLFVEFLQWNPGGQPGDPSVPGPGGDSPQPGDTGSVAS